MKTTVFVPLLVRTKGVRRGQSSEKEILKRPARLPFWRHEA